MRRADVCEVVTVGASIGEGSGMRIITTLKPLIPQALAFAFPVTQGIAAAPGKRLHHPRRRSGPRRRVDQTRSFRRIATFRPVRGSA